MVLARSTAAEPPSASPAMGTPTPVEVYMNACGTLKCRPNPGILKQLKAAKALEAVTSLNCVDNFLGAHGVAALFPVLRACRGITHVKLTENGMRNETALELFDVLREECPSVVSLDLSGNKHLNLVVGTAAMKLAKNKRTILHLLLQRTGVSRTVQDKLEMILSANRQHRADRLARRLEGLHIDKDTYFAARRVFSVLDNDANGCVSQQEMHSARSLLAHKAEELQFPFDDIATMDTDGDSVVTLEEYLRACFPSARATSLEQFEAIYNETVAFVGEFTPPEDMSLEDLREVHKIFTMYDANADGRVTGPELKNALGRSALAINPEEYLSIHDANGDGYMDFGEFMQAMRYYYTGRLRGARPPRR